MYDCISMCINTLKGFVHERPSEAIKPGKLAHLPRPSRIIARIPGELPLQHLAVLA